MSKSIFYMEITLE